MPTPSEQLALGKYLDLRDSLRVTRIGRGGLEVCAQLTDTLDAALTTLISPVPEGVAVVALGGYGRGELSPYSDVDLMLLHSGVDPSELAAALFRPLWDAKLRVGHAVRTVEEAASAARARFDTQTTLLTMRLVAGDADVYDRLVAEVVAVTKARPLRRHLVSEERSRRTATPFLLMATDVKTGRGGLRTLHGFEWERRREELIGRFSTQPSVAEEEAKETLLRVRNGLHVAAGRSHDIYSTDLREPVARWLGGQVSDVAGELVEAMKTIDRVAARRWPDVVDQKPKGILARLSGRPAPLSATRPPRVDELIWMLETGEEGRAAFERFWEVGQLEQVLPEWDVTRTLPQLAPFHEHPVADHLWRTVDLMLSLLDDDGPLGRVAAEVADPAVLLLAAFLHDIGKGHGGDHAEEGAKIARSFCTRMGLPTVRSQLIVGAVRQHLLLPVAATRRDLDDPAVIDDITATVGSLRLLQVLYLLAVADSTATGATIWSDWKATLVETLFLRCAARLGADRVSEIGTTPHEVMAAIGADRDGEVAAHLSAMPDDYLRTVTTDEVLWHVDMLCGLEGASSVGVRSGDAAQTAVVVGKRRPEFRRRVAEAFAANGIDVLEARLFSREDGMIVDSFRVRDDRTEDPVEKGKLESFRRDVEAGLVGDLDTGSKVMARAAAYREGRGKQPEVRATLDEATGELMLTVNCSDRIGRLAEILSVLSELDLDIRLAKIDSRGGEVVDTFYVAGYDPGRDTLTELEGRVSRQLRP